MVVGGRKGLGVVVLLRNCHGRHFGGTNRMAVTIGRRSVITDNATATARGRES